MPAYRTTKKRKQTRVTFVKRKPPAEKVVKTFRLNSKDIWEIEYLLAARVMEDGLWHYLVKWAGFTNDWNEWMPEEVLFDQEYAYNLIACFHKYAENMGKDMEKRHLRGYTVVSSREYTEWQKAEFWKGYNGRKQVFEANELAEQYGGYEDPFEKAERFLNQFVDNRKGWEAYLPPDPQIDIPYLAELDSDDDEFDTQFVQASLQQQDSDQEAADDDEENQEEGTSTPTPPQHNLADEARKRYKSHRSAKIIDTQVITYTRMTTKKRVTSRPYAEFAPIEHTPDPEPQLVPDSSTSPSKPRNGKAKSTAGGDQFRAAADDIADQFLSQLNIGPDDGSQSVLSTSVQVEVEYYQSEFQAELEEGEVREEGAEVRYPGTPWATPPPQSPFTSSSSSSTTTTATPTGRTASPTPSFEEDNCEDEDE